MTKSADADNTPPFETEDLRNGLMAYLNTPFEIEPGRSAPIGNFKWGVYAFFDYDGEPIYVGQTNEKVRTRIGRHLTNQRTDAVAMSVLDPFEVFEARGKFASDRRAEVEVVRVWLQFLQRAHDHA